jgi:hypothetical protein
MTANLERGHMYKGKSIAVRMMAHKHVPYGAKADDARYKVEWGITMPRRDHRFGVLPQSSRYNQSPEEKALEQMHGLRTDVHDGQVEWVTMPYEWAWGVYIGDVRKYNGQVERAIYEDDGGGFNYGATKVRLATVALHGSDNGFVLAYVFHDDMEEM